MGNLTQAIIDLQVRIDNLASELSVLRMEQATLTTGKRWLNYPEAAALLNTTVGSLAVDVSKRKIPFIKRGRRVLFDKKALEEHLVCHQVLPSNNRK